MLRFLMLLVVVLLATPASAFTNEDLYKHCKRYANNGYELKDEGDVACVTYFVAVGHLTDQQCALSDSKNSLLMSSYDSSKLDMYIQNYVNFLREHTEYWGFNPSATVATIIAGDSPCDR